jgi:hypothetical protein
MDVTCGGEAFGNGFRNRLSLGRPRKNSLGME